jgi:hypothetical protein
LGRVGQEHKFVYSSHRQNALRFFFFFAGFCPIVSLSLALMEVVNLRLAALYLVAPTAIAAVAIGCWHPHYRRLAFRGLFFGLAATFFYDLFRIPSVLFGAWPDFIPNIAELLLRQHQSNWVVGYLWRYFGNGGGMGVAYLMLVFSERQRASAIGAGLAYGVIIWIGLIVTRLNCTHSELMFPLTPTTFLLSLLGHLIYGLALGILTRKWPCSQKPFISDDATRHLTHFTSPVA